MSKILHSGLWFASEPSEVFEPSGFGPEALNAALDRKLSKVSGACGENHVAARFSTWMSEKKDLLSALILYVPDIICIEPIPPTLLIVADKDCTGLQLVELSHGFGSHALRSSAASLSNLEGGCIQHDVDWIRHVRAGIAGEVFIWARTIHDTEMTMDFIKRVKARFLDGNVVDDLGLLLTLDIHLGIKEGREQMPQDSREFEGIARRAMNRRKVERKDSVLRGRLLDNITKRLDIGGVPGKIKRSVMA